MYTMYARSVFEPPVGSLTSPDLASRLFVRSSFVRCQIRLRISCVFIDRTIITLACSRFKREPEDTHYFATLQYLVDAYWEICPRSDELRLQHFALLRHTSRPCLYTHHWKKT